MKLKHEWLCFRQPSSHQRLQTSSWSPLPPGPLLAGGDRQPPASSLQPHFSLWQTKLRAEGKEKAWVGASSQRGWWWSPSGWDHRQAPPQVSEQRGLDWPNALLLQPGILRPPPGLSHPLHPHPGSSPLPGQPGLWPQLLQQDEREKAWLTPFSDRF